MRPYFWLLLLKGFLCNEYPLRIPHNPLIVWEGSCMLIPCHVDETLHSDRLKPTAVVWFFQPVFDGRLLSYTGQLLYDSSKTSSDLMNLTSPSFRGRVRFVGDLSQGDCSLKITKLHANDNGTYGVVVAASVENQTGRQMLYQKVVAHVRESPPEPKIETVEVESQEWWTMKVACSVAYHCPDEPMTLTFIDLEGSRQKMTIANGMVQTVASVEPVWKDEKYRKMTCLLHDKDGLLRYKASLELDGPLIKEGERPHQTPYTSMEKAPQVTTAVDDTSIDGQPIAGPSITMGSWRDHPKDVQLVLLNDLPIKEGHDVRLNCSVGRSVPDDNWYNWIKLDAHTAEIQYSHPKLLTFPAAPGPAISYQCEACNRFGCMSSQKISIEVHFSPKEVKILKWSPEHIVEGSEVKLKCEVGMANPSNLTYTWYRGEEQRKQNSTEEMLIFSSVSSKDSDDYWCEVSNSVGTTVSSKVTLCVLCAQCYESPLSIALNSLAAWEGSCVWIPCRVSEPNISDKINITSLLWYFDPYMSYDHVDHLLYDGSKTSMDLMNRTSPNFRGRVKFVGDLNNADCSLLVTQLQTKDSGWYRARVVISVPNYPWPLTRFLSAAVNITESPAEPKIRTDPLEMHEGRLAKVICSALYHCPGENMTLTLTGLEKDRLLSQQTAIESGTVRTVLSFRPILEDHGKVLRCLYKSQAGSQRSQGTMKLDVKFAPREVRAVQDPEEVIKVGSPLQLECKVGKANPQDLNYTWYKNGQQLPQDFASSALLTLQRVGFTDTGLYHCEANNSVGTSGSLQVELTSLCSPSLPDDCYIKAWNP
uniref:B-cell receptor CD22 n=1 Tax=Pogona vitticeps TaxID=103695 RepID=A0ABM5ERM8_9SAUR